MLNAGLAVLGTEERTFKEDTFCGAFQGSGLVRVRLPSTLRVIGKEAFMGCTGLKAVLLPDGL